MLFRSLNGARGVLISITGSEDLTLYEVDEAASRIRQEVDEEANIIVGAIIEPALEQTMRVSVVATGIDQSANRRMDPQPFAKPVLPQTLHRLHWTRPRERPSAQSSRVHQSPRAQSSRLRLFQRPSSHFQSRPVGVWTRRRTSIRQQFDGC